MEKKDGRKEEKTRIVNRKKIEWMVSHGTMERRRKRKKEDKEEEGEIGEEKDER